MFVGISVSKGNKLEHEGHHFDNTPLSQLCLVSEMLLGESTNGIHHVAGPALVRSEVTP